MNQPLPGPVVLLCECIFALCVTAIVCGAWLGRMPGHPALAVLLLVLSILLWHEFQES